MGPAPEDSLVADLGNRYLKLAVVSHGIIHYHEVHPADDALAGLPWNLPTSLARVAYASVNPAREVALEAWILNGGGCAAEKLGRDLDVPLRTACRGVGMDRLVNGLAALRRFPGGAVVADIGTAVTVDLVSPDAEFLGGAILPGPHLGARALAEYAAQLPCVEPARPVHALGRATAEAIRSGLHHGTIGAIRELIRVLDGAVAFRPALVVTGGDAPGFLSAFPAACHVPNLTLEGVAACM